MHINKCNDMSELTLDRHCVRCGILVVDFDAYYVKTERVTLLKVGEWVPAGPDDANHPELNEGYIPSFF